jgi:hypothetical protein
MTSDPRALRTEDTRDSPVFPPLALAVSAVGMAWRASRASCAAVRAGITRFRDEVEEQVRADRARAEARRSGGRTTVSTSARSRGAGRVSPATTTATAAESEGAGAASSTESATELALPDYDHLPASQIVAMLADLDRPELDAIESYELAHRHRRTVLGKIDQLRAGR